MTFAAVRAFLAAPPAWAVMWAIAFGTFFACKWLTWARQANSLRGRAADAAAYFLAWPGMDPAAFLQRGAGEMPDLHKLPGAVARILSGIALVTLVVPRLRIGHPTVAGAVGMAGLILVLHFGVFEVMSVLWRRRGVEAVPLMNARTRATSLADFWGKRWNTAFHELARRFVFMPLRRRMGVTGATLATFLASGVVHDLVISVPARGGYGLPTIYFLIQGAGVLFERTRVARRLGLRPRAATARVFTAIVIVAPVPLLFPPPFLTRVILPFLEVIP
jgi:alginate O-acetyltransferase complex protein AlgI